MANRFKQINEIDIEQLEQMAGLHFSIRELALIFKVDLEFFELAADDEDHPVYFAINRGRLMAEAEVRKAAFTLAKNGSTQGIKEANNFINNSKLDDGS